MIVNKIVKNKAWLVHLSAYLFMMFYLCIGIFAAIGPESVQERTTLYLVFVSTGPMLFVLNSFEIISIIVPAECWYLLAIATYQSEYPVYMTNQDNSLFFAVIGVILGIYMSNMRVSGIYHTYMTSHMVEMAPEDRYAFEEEKKKALAAGMNGHLAKPVEIEKLKQILYKNIGV